MIRRLALGTMLLIAGSCVRSTSIECDHGRLCPIGTECDEIHSLCTTQDQRDVCEAQPMGMTCTYGGQSGRCDRGVCVPGDADLDGVANDDDNCPSIANPTQADRDTDGFGDACDTCPDLATAVNHDEDGDGHGDLCDICPTTPDFQADRDSDGVGDECAKLYGGHWKQLAFEPFLGLGPWTSSTAIWEASGDAVMPTSPLAPTDPGLVDREIVDATTDVWIAEVGFAVTRPLVAGDRFGISLVDDAGGLIASCEATCVASNCNVDLVLDSGRNQLSPPVLTFQPTGFLRLKAMGNSFACHINEASAFASGSTSGVGGAVAISSTPGIAIRSLVVWSVQ